MKVSEDCSVRTVDSNKSKKSKVSSLLKPSLIALAVAQSMSVATAEAATIHVGGSDGAGCDLIGAIISANTDAASPDNVCTAGSGNDMIELHQDVMLTEPWQDTARGLPIVSSVITFNGNGHTISRDINADNFGFIRVDRTGYLESVNDLTLTNATASDNDPNMTTVIDGAYNLNNVVLLNNSGAQLIKNKFSSDYLTITDSRFENNEGTAISFNPRGFSYLDIQNTVISNNMGRAIDVPLGRYPSVTISDSVISNNAANECAAFSAVQNTLFLSIDNTTVSNNTALNNGGAICLYDVTAYEGFYRFSLNLTDSTISGNSAGGDGGAIFAYSNANTEVVIQNSTISNNSAAGLGGAFSFQSNGPFMRFDSGSVPFTYTELDTRAELITINSTIVDNSASSGGAIYTDDKGIVSLSLTNSIIAGNSATVAGSEIYNLSPSSFPVEAEVISNNNVLGSSVESNFQAFYGFVPSATDITTTIDGNNPALLDEIVSPLQDNGGVTETHALPAGSPAIDVADINACNNDPISGLDQRGEVRGEAGLCDIGAYELSGSTGDLPSINIDSVEVSEGDRKATLKLSLSSPQTERIPVDFQTVDGTATEGLDYTGRFGTLTFAPGQTKKVRVIQLNDDNLSESTESFSLMLSNPVGATLEQAIGEVTILDDDGLPTISIEPAEHSVFEGDFGNSRRVRYTINLSSAQTEKVSVDYQTMDQTAIGGVDYEIRSGRMTFMPGQTSKIRTVNVLGDTEPEADETFKLVFSNPSNNTLLDFNEADSVGTILDNDSNSLPTISIEPAAHSVNEGASDDQRRVVYTVTLSAPQTERVSLDYQTMDQSAVGGVDYQVTSGSMTFAPGQTSKIRTVEVLTDSETESDETFKYVLSNPSSNAVIDVDEADTIGTIVDNDDDVSPIVSIRALNPEIYEGDKNANGLDHRRVSFVIEMSPPTSEYVVVSFASMDITAIDGEDYRGESSGVGFLPGQVSKPFSFLVISDDEVEPDETFKVAITSTSDNAMVDPDQTEQIVTILDNDR